MLSFSEEISTLVQHAVAHLFRLLGRRAGELGFMGDALEAGGGGGVAIPFVAKFHARRSEGVREGDSLSGRLLQCLLEFGETVAKSLDLGRLPSEFIGHPSGLRLGRETLANLPIERWRSVACCFRIGGGGPWLTRPLRIRVQPGSAALIERSDVDELSAPLSDVPDGKRLHDPRDLADPEAIWARGAGHDLDHLGGAPIERFPSSRHEPWEKHLDQWTEVSGIVGWNLASRPRSSHTTMVPAC